MQQVHAWLVGLGVSQGEKGRQLEPHSVSRIAALRTEWAKHESHRNTARRYKTIHSYTL